MSLETELRKRPGRAPSPWALDVGGSRSLSAVRKTSVLLSGFVLLSVLVLPGCVLANANLQEVAPARLYRSGQMDAATLQRNVERLGIRTVINLRGGGARNRFWREEVEVCRELGVVHHDLHWRESRLPAPTSLAAYVSWLREAPEPILVHCKAGVQRAAVGAAVFLLREGWSPAVARRQFGLLFLDARVGDVVDLYEGSKLPFDRWVLEVYPGLYRQSPEGRTE